MKPVAAILGSERCTLFLGDKKAKTLYAIVAKGNEDIIIEIPDHKGRSCFVFSTNVYTYRHRWKRVYERGSAEHYRLL